MDAIDTALQAVGWTISSHSPTTLNPGSKRLWIGLGGSSVAVKGSRDRQLDTEAVSEGVALIRAKTTLPIAVGFGIKTRDARAVAAAADAVVVGSALIDKMEQEAAAGNVADQVHGAAVNYSKAYALVWTLHLPR